MLLKACKTGFFKTCKICVEVVAVLIAGVAIAIGIGAWRLSTGPVEIESLTPYVERALTPADKSFSVKVKKTVLRWGGWERPLVVDVTDLRATRPDGKALARIPEGAIHFSGKALLRGTVAPTSIEVRKPRIELRRNADGRFVFDVTSGAGEKDDGGAGLIAAIFAGRTDGPLGYLRSVRVTDARMTIRDAHLGIDWQAPKASMLLERNDGGVRMSAALAVIIRERRINVSAAGLYRIGDRRTDLAVSFTGLEPGLFADAGGTFKALTLLNSVRIPLDGKLLLQLERGGHLKTIGFELSGGKGAIALVAPYRQSMQIASLRLEGRIDGGFEAIRIGQLKVDFGGPVLEVRGEVATKGDTTTIKADAAMRNVPTDDLGVYWPAGVADSPRRWVTTNISGGVLPEVTARIRARVVGDKPIFDSVTGAFLLHGLSVRFLNGLPPVTQANGTATFTDDRIDFKVRAGRLAGLSLTGATVNIFGFSSPDPLKHQIRIDGTLKGALSEALKIIDRKPLGYAKRVGVAPKAASGEADIRLRVGFPLLDALTLDEVDIRADAKVTRFGWRRGPFGADLKGGALTLGVDKEKMTVNGRVAFKGAPVQVNWTEHFLEDAKVARTVIVRANVGEQLRSALGLGDAERVKGPVGVRARFVEGKRGGQWLSATLDLAKARLTLPALGWEKAAGQPGKATVRAALRRGRIREISAFTLAAGGIDAKGSMTFDVKGEKLAVLLLDRFRYGRTDASLKVTAREDAGYSIEVRGKRLDVSRMIARSRPKRPKPATPETASPNIAAVVNVDRLYLSSDGYLSAVRARAARVGGRWTDIHADAVVAPGKTLRVRFAYRGPGRALSVVSNDAGATLRAVGLHDNVVGGRLDIRGTILDRKGEPFAGRVTVKNYRVVNSPILERVVGVNKEQFDEVRGELKVGRGVTFKEFIGPFTFVDGRLFVKQGRAIARSVGITFEGRLDLRNNQIGMDGTVVPAYALNSLLGKVPLVGNIFVGKKGSGVFAVAFTAEGPLDKPKVKVHTLSALTPGILRNLFHKFGGNANNAELPRKKKDPIPAPGNGDPFMNER